MSLKDDIVNKVKAIIDEQFNVEDVSYVPDIGNSKLTFGNTGLQFEATVLFIDMRGSTGILNKHNKPVVAKIHMAYFHTVVKIANSLGGEVRSFNGDSMLVFFPGTTKVTLTNAVSAALQMKYMITDAESGINKYLSDYSAIDFGIGLDYGKILCTKIGVGGDSNNQDLIWIGNPVNKAVVISDKSKQPYHVAVSNIVYSNLFENMKVVVKKDNWGNEQKVNIWLGGSITYDDKNEDYYYTSYQCTL